MSRPRIDCLYRLGRLLSRIFLPTFGSIRVAGRENVPAAGPLIIAANHQSNADPPVLVYAVSRPINFMAKRSLFANAFVSFFFRMLHVYPVDRDGRDVDALRWALRMLDAGEALLIFPEGTRSPGALSEASDGLAYLALASGAPVLPVGIAGTERIGAMLRIPFHFQRLSVNVGEPFTLPAPDGRIDRAALRAGTNAIMERVAALLPPSYRGAYASPVATEDAPEGTFA